MDADIGGACLVAITEDLKSTSVESFWVGTSFVLAQTVTIPIYGTTSEMLPPCPPLPGLKTVPVVNASPWTATTVGPASIVP
ncbi:hypothetical protein V1521DRAFT_437419 [Lipomyces starkeyi]